MRAAAIVFVLAGIILGVARQVGASPAEADARGVVASVAYGAAIAMPGVIAFVGRRGLVTIAAGIAGMSIAVVASFGATLPLLVPGIVLVARGMRDSRKPDDGFRALLIACLLPWAVVVLYVHDDPAAWANGMVSDITVWWESLASLGLSTLVLLAACVGSSGPGADDGEHVVGGRPASDERGR